jgi:thiamine kinase-like enzyme
MARELISKNATKSVYRDGDMAIKVFCKGFPKAEVLNEALVSARIEEIGGINIPATLKVEVDDDGCWAIYKEFISGKTLKQLMDENPDKLEEYMEGMVDLHLLIHKQACPLLNKLKEKTIRALKSVEQLDDSTRYELMTRLDGMPKHTKLCHGDFNPTNIIVGDDGKWYVIDWVHASQGNASADVARTYLLLSLKDRKRAELYMDLFCEKTGTEKRYVQGWLPVVAAAQLAYKRPEEKELLESWINVFEYQ